MGHHLANGRVVDRFNAIVAHGDYVRAKPSPEPYLAAATALGVAAENCLALEDSYNGVRAGAAAGMMTIMVPDILDATEEMRSLCVRIAVDLHEVIELIQAGRFGQPIRCGDDQSSPLAAVAGAVSVVGAAANGTPTPS